MLINIFCRTYNWFLFAFGLLSFKECVTWPWYKGRIFFSHKTYRIMYHWKENVMLINISNRTYSWFLSVFDLLTFKEWVTWPWCKGKPVFLAKPIAFRNIRKRILCWSLFTSEPMANFNLFKGYRPSKNGSRVKHAFAPPEQPIVFCVTGN